MLIQIEITNACNLSCSYCPRTAHPQKYRKMTTNEILHILKEVAVLPNLHEHRVVLCGHGEPLLNASIHRVIQDPIVQAIPHLDLITNGMLLSNVAAHALIDSKAFETIQVSLQTTDPDVYPKLQVGGDFHKVLKNTKHLIETARDSRTTIKVQYLRTMLNNEEDYRHFKELLGDNFKYHEHNVGPVGMRTLRTAYDHIIPILDNESPLYGHKRACDKIYGRSIIINAFGELLGCCWDNSREQHYGNIFFTPLNRIRKSKRLKEMRAELKARNFDRLPLCKVCMEIPT